MARHSHISNTLQNAQKLSQRKVLCIIYPIALVFVRFPTNQEPIVQVLASGIQKWPNLHLQLRLT